MLRLLRVLRVALVAGGASDAGVASGARVAVEEALGADGPRV